MSYYSFLFEGYGRKQQKLQRQRVHDLVRQKRADADAQMAQNLASFANKPQSKWTDVAKFKRITATPAVAGQVLDTTLANGHKEVVGRKLNGDEFVAQNYGNGAGPEKWAIDPKTFKKKYQPDTTLDPDGSKGIYMPKGGPMRATRIDRDMTIKPKYWGGYTQNLKRGDYMLQDPTNPDDIYGIGGGRKSRSEVIADLKSQNGGYYPRRKQIRKAILATNSNPAGEFNVTYAPAGDPRHEGRF